MGVALAIQGGHLYLRFCRGVFVETTFSGVLVHSNVLQVTAFRLTQADTGWKLTDRGFVERPDSTKFRRNSKVQCQLSSLAV